MSLEKTVICVALYRYVNFVVMAKEVTNFNSATLKLAFSTKSPLAMTTCRVPC